jgi:hypothetical protein
MISVAAVTGPSRNRVFKYSHASIHGKGPRGGFVEHISPT